MTDQHRRPEGGDQWEPGPAAVPAGDRTAAGREHQAERDRQWARNRDRLTGPGSDGRTRPRNGPADDGGYGFLDPPAVADTGSGSGAPKVAELLSRVICAIAPQPDVVQSQKYGEMEVARLRWLVVFEPRTGTPTAYPDYLFFSVSAAEGKCWAARPHWGRLMRPGQAYELEPVSAATRNRAGELLVEGGWIADDGTPAAAPNQCPAKIWPPVGRIRRRRRSILMTKRTTTRAVAVMAAALMTITAAVPAMAAPPATGPVAVPAIMAADSPQCQAVAAYREWRTARNDLAAAYDRLFGTRYLAHPGGPERRVGTAPSQSQAAAARRAVVAALEVLEPETGRTLRGEYEHKCGNGPVPDPPTNGTRPAGRPAPMPRNRPRYGYRRRRYGRSHITKGGAE